MSEPSPRGDSGYAPTVKAAVERGFDLVGTVRDSAVEAIRTRRDPVHVAERRRVAARRRLVVWSISSIALAGVGATGIVEAAHGEASAASIGVLVLVMGLLSYSVVGAVAAGRDLVARTKLVRRLPPPQPARRPVAASLRPLLAQLDGYSDALRASVGMIGTEDSAPRRARRDRRSAGSDDPMLSLRNDTLAAADAAESRIRAKAAEFTALRRAGTAAVAGSQERLTGEIAAGVADYGRLVAAASDAAGAWTHLASTTAPLALAEATDRLTALADGMRAVTVLPSATNGDR